MTFRLPFFKYMLNCKLRVSNGYSEKSVHSFLCNRELYEQSHLWTSICILIRRASFSQVTPEVNHHGYMYLMDAHLIRQNHFVMHHSTRINMRMG